MVNNIEKAAMILGSVGALNWGLVYWLNFNVVSFITNFLPVTGVDKIIYGLVGLSGAWALYYAFKN